MFTYFRYWTNLIEYFAVTPSYVQTLSDGTVIIHSFNPVGIMQMSHKLGSATISIIDITGTNVYGTTLFDNTGSASCPLPGVPVELIRDNGQILKTNSAADGTFSFSVALGEPVKVRIPPFNGFSWSSTYHTISESPTGRRLKATTKANVASLTSSPTLMHYSVAKMVHRFTFDYPTATNTAQVPDIADANDVATMHNGLTLSQGLAVFSQSSNPSARPYLELPPSLFGVADAISIEMWVTVDTSTPNTAILFSLGDSSNPDAYISLSAAGFQGFTNTYMAIIIDPPSGAFNVYVNGTLSSSQSISKSPIFNGEGSSEHFNCIGWDLKKSTPGFIGSIDEIRFWDGALSIDRIWATEAAGVDPTLVTLNSNNTFYNVQIDYLVTSEVAMNIGFFGGLSRNKMFGSESMFLIQALDPQCAFNTTVVIDPYYSAVSLNLPAMNYSVALLPFSTPLPAPTFSNSLCSASLDPYSYLSAANQLSVDVYTNLLETFNLNATFIYHTGLCVFIKGAENFATSIPTPDPSGRVCYSNSATMLNRGQAWPLNITLFELYPSYTGANPQWTSVLDVASGSAVEDLLVLDSTVEITDPVSGLTSPSTFVYSNEPYTNADSAQMQAPSTINYTITAAIPLPSIPFALAFTVRATRNSPEGAAVVVFKAFIPILGTIPSEVPNFYPVTTDPTLIFMVLRDPPGGASSTTITAGSTFTTGISIEGLKTYEQDIHASLELRSAAALDELLVDAPLGFGLATKIGIESLKIGVKGELVAPDVKISRVSDTQYSYSFQFNYAFSTSDDAFIAGHPSDVIIGGGIDVIVSQTLEGDNLQYDCIAVTTI